MSRRRLISLFVAIVASAMALLWKGDRSSDRAHRQNWHNYGDSASALNKLAHSLGGRSRLTAWMQFYVERLQHRYERESEAEMEASNLVTIICRPKYAPIFATLFVWRSPASMLQERAEAAAQLVAKGDTRPEAERVLGRPARYSHFLAAPTEEPAYAALTNDLTVPAGLAPTQAQNLWCDIYEFPGGAYVCFCYDAGASVHPSCGPTSRLSGYGSVTRMRPTPFNL